MAKDATDESRKISKADRRMMSRLGRIFTEQMIQQEFLDGKISIKGKSEEEARQLIAAHIKTLLKTKKLEFKIIVDHTVDLLKRARIAHDEKFSALAAFFYTTYFEHRLNRIISNLARRRKLAATDITAMLRDANLRSKCSWLLASLGTKKIAKHHAKVIEAIAQVRNYFVHYKWHPEDKQIAQSHEQLLEKAEGVVRYLRRFENQVVYSGQKKHIARTIGRAKPKK